MPIYAYRCTNCGHAQDVLQKISDPLLTVCPACGQPTYAKQVTAAGFQLKGSGWYVTDFRGDGKAQKKGDGDATVDKPVDAGAAKADPAGKADKPAGDLASKPSEAKPVEASKPATPAPSPSPASPAPSPPPKAGD